MRLGLAGGVIVVLVVFAIVMLQPGSPRLGHGLLRAQSPWSAAPRWVMQLCRAGILPSQRNLSVKSLQTHQNITALRSRFAR